MGQVLDRAAVGYRRATGTADPTYALAGLLTLIALAEVAAGTTEQPTTTSFGLLLALAATVPLALSRPQPEAGATLVGAAVLVTLLSDRRLPVAAVAALAVAFLLLGRRRSRLAAALLSAPFLGYALAPLSASAPGGRPLAVLLLAVSGGAAVTGVGLRARRQAVRRDASDRALAHSALEHAARGERARIARELHDVVAHHISMIAVQAEATRLTTPGMPPDGAKRLIAIGDTARDALTEMRRLLGVLREDAGTEPTRHPQPGLHQLNDLLDSARELSNASTRLIVRGTVAPLGPGVELTAYRIVQEALTNARRHAAGAAVDVELDFRDGALVLRVRDNGPGPPPGGATPLEGHGLTGMQERAAMVGGRLRAGPAPWGGFVVDAVLPARGADA